MVHHVMRWWWWSTITAAAPAVSVARRRWAFVALRRLAFARLGGRDLDAYTRSLPQRVVEAGDGRLGVVRVVHVHEAEVFENVAFDDLAELLKQLLELRVARRAGYVADVNLDGR